MSTWKTSCWSCSHSHPFQGFCSLFTFSVPWSSCPLESATLPLPGAPPAFLTIISHSVLAFFTAPLTQTFPGVSSSMYCSHGTFYRIHGENLIYSHNNIIKWCWDAFSHLLDRLMVSRLSSMVLTSFWILRPQPTGLFLGFIIFITSRRELILPCKLLSPLNSQSKCL